MKTPADTQTQDAFPKDVFELNAAEAWPFPEPLPEWQPKQEAEPSIQEWMERILKP